MHHDTVRAQERLAWSGDLRMRIASGSLFVPALPFFLFFLHFGLLLTQRTPPTIQLQYPRSFRISPCLFLHQKINPKG